MQSWLLDHYSWVKALHIVAMVSWMAAMLYLPRLFVYHTGAAVGSVQSETFKIMERRLLRAICTPAMIVTWIAGLLMLHANPGLLEQGWMHAKLTLVLVMSGIHGLFSKWRKDFAADRNTRSHTFYRFWNEAPTLVMVIVIILAIVKPF